MRVINKLFGLVAAVAIAIALCPGVALAQDKTADAEWIRLAGKDALGTMYEICEASFNQGSCDTVVLATSEGYWDALTAAGIAGQYRCPVLLTNPYTLFDETRYQIARIGASRAIITGGTAAISYTVESTLVNEMGMNVERAAGDDAALTAIDIYQKGQAVEPWSNTAVIATASGYWDAMSVSPYAFAAHAPVFLARETTEDGSTYLDQTTLNAIAAGGFERVVICGGPAAISGVVEGQLSGLSVIRLQGPTAIETSQAIANFCAGEGMQPDGLAVATTEGYWDGLVGAALCGCNNAPLILARPEDPSTAVNGFVSSNRNSITCGYVLGGTAAIPEAVKTALEEATKLANLTAASIAS